MNSKFRVVIADDHVIFRQGIKSLLDRQDLIEVVGEAANGEELLRLCEELQPDLAFVDIKMPIIDGVAATKELKIISPLTKIIALTMYNDDNLIVDMIHNGASGYLLKDATLEEINKAAQVVIDGGKYYCKETEAKLNKLIEENRFRHNKMIPVVVFSEREKQVMQLICEELTTKEIAARLNLSQRTIDSYRDSLQQKTETKNAVGLIVYAIKHGLVSI